MTRRCILASPLAALLRADSDAQIRFDGSSFRVEGWTPSPEPAGGWSEVFIVHAGEKRGGPAMLGTYSIADGLLTFKPRFRPSPGVSMRAVFRPSGERAIERIFREEAPAAAPTTFVENVFPTAGVVPANLLKFYLQFSGPMQRNQAWQNLSLLDRNGAKLELPFLELDQELWDRDNRRLTVLFDPGRIKHGVLPRGETGTALTEGAEYTLVIGSDWQDATGARLKAPFRKRFRVTAEDRRAIDVHQWKLEIPSAGTTDPLQVEFGEPLDYALLQHTLEMRASKGPVTGEVKIGREETTWSFQPHEPWRHDEYLLVIDKSLEDLAGNQVGKPFDVDTFDPITTRTAAKTESLRFLVRPKQRLQSPR